MLYCAMIGNYFRKEHDMNLQLIAIDEILKKLTEISEQNNEILAILKQNPAQYPHQNLQQ